MNAVPEDGPAVDRQLLDWINGAWITQAIAVACELDLPDRLAGRPRHAREIAAEARVDARALERLLRALATLDICRMADDGTHSLGPLGVRLLRGHEEGLRNWAMLNGGPLWSRWGALRERIREGGPGPWPGGSRERFDRLETDPREAELFHGAMAELSRRLVGSLSDALDLPGKATVVDVGGGSGELLAGLLARHPSARGILVDLPSALARAGAVLERRGVADRCEVRAGSFFDELPEGGDVYLLKSVLHDWDDAHVARLLRRCRRALLPAAHVVVVERLVPDRHRAAPEHRALARSDLNMLVGLAGRERRLEEYRTLAEEAGLALRDVRPLAAGFHAIRLDGRLGGQDFGTNPCAASAPSPKK